MELDTTNMIFYSGPSSLDQTDSSSALTFFSVSIYYALGGGIK